MSALPWTSTGISPPRCQREHFSVDLPGGGANGNHRSTRVVFSPGRAMQTTRIGHEDSGQSCGRWLVPCRVVQGVSHGTISPKRPRDRTSSPMTKSLDCPMCRTPSPWEPRSSNETYRYKGQAFSLSDIEYSVCRECGFDLVLPHQTRRNEARVRDEYRRIDRLLTAR